MIQIVTVLEDAVLAFRKLKNGILIFDDYGWGGLYLTQKSIDAFISGYYKRINILGQEDIQFYLCSLFTKSTNFFTYCCDIR